MSRFERKSSYAATRLAQVSTAAMITALSAAVPAQSQEYSFRSIGELPGGNVQGAANGVSDSGAVVIGTSGGVEMVDNGMGPFPVNGAFGFRWTAAGGMVSLGDLPGGIIDAYAYGVSADGSVVVGSATSAAGGRATRWTQATGHVDLGKLPGGQSFSTALDVSDDGTVVVGQSGSAVGTQAFRWSVGDPFPTGLGFLGKGIISGANGVSGDGTVIVGYSQTGNGFDQEAFRWTQAGGMVGLGDFAGSDVHSVANDTNIDGSVIVGFGRPAGFNQEAFRWTAAGGMVSLGQLPNGVRSEAKAVSDDGTIVVGQAVTTTAENAFRWTEATGMTNLNDVLVAKNVDLGTLQLISANEISADGKFIVGEALSATGTEAFISVYDDSKPAAEAGVILVNDFTQSASSVSGTSRIAAASGESLDNGLEFAGLNYELEGDTATVSTQGQGALERTGLERTGQTLSFAGFAFGEGSRMLETSQSTRQTTYGGIGVMGHAKHIGLRFGLGALAANQTTTTSALGSRSRLNARGAGLWLTYAPAPTGVEIMVAASRLSLAAKIDRNYLNGAATETSSGTTSGTYTGLQGRFGYAFAVRPNLILTPFGGLSSHVSSLASYTETGGTFAANVTGQSASVRKARIGLDARFRARSDLEFTGGLSFERVTETGTLSTLGVTALGGASFGGGTVARTYNAAHVSFGVNHQLGNGITLHSEIDIGRALTAGASDINQAGLKLGATIRF